MAPQANTNLQDQLAAANEANNLLQQRLAASEASLDSTQARLVTAERVQHAAQSAAAELSDRVQELEAETLTLAQAQTAAAEEARKEKTMRAQYEEVGGTCTVDPMQISRGGYSF